MPEKTGSQCISCSDRKVRERREAFATANQTAPTSADANSGSTPAWPQDASKADCERYILGEVIGWDLKSIVPSKPKILDHAAGSLLYFPQSVAWDLDPKQASLKNVQNINARVTSSKVFQDYEMPTMAHLFPNGPSLSVCIPSFVGT